jgi:hypothetical protein
MQVRKGDGGNVRAGFNVVAYMFPSCSGIAAFEAFSEARRKEIISSMLAAG